MYILWPTLPNIQTDIQTLGTSNQRHHNFLTFSCLLTNRRKLLEGEESRFNVGMAGGVSALYGHTLSVPSYSRPFLSSMSSGSYYMTSRLLSSSVSTTEGILSASHARQAEASPPGEEEEEEAKEEEGVGDGEEAKEGEEG